MTTDQLFAILNVMTVGSVAAAGVPAANALDSNKRSSQSFKSWPLWFNRPIISCARLARYAAASEGCET